MAVSIMIKYGLQMQIKRSLLNPNKGAGALDADIKEMKKAYAEVTDMKCNCISKIQTEHLILRHWQETDAESLYKYAKDPEVGPIAGWTPHKSVEESLSIIQNVLCGAECYAICEKENNIAIGAIELRLNGHTDMAERDDECELGYWLGKPFWGRGYMPEAANEILRHAFEDIGMATVWCGYYDGNLKSKRVQEKLGFIYHHTCNNVPVPLMNEIRTGHTNMMTKEKWLSIYKNNRENI